MKVIITSEIKTATLDDIFYFEFDSKPSIGITYDALEYDSTTGDLITFKDNEASIIITTSPKTKLETFINNLTDAKKFVKYGVSATGKYLGRASLKDSKYSASIPAPDDGKFWIWNDTAKVWSLMLAVNNSTGEFLGNIDPDTPNITNVGSIPPHMDSVNYTWDFASGKWVAKKIKAVNAKGIYLGEVDRGTENAIEVSSFPIDNSFYWNGSDWAKIIGVDESGTYIGDDANAYAFVSAMPEEFYGLNLDKFIWNFTESKWEYTLSGKKDSMKVAVNDLRTQKIGDGFTFDGVKYDTFEASINNITSLIAGIAAGFPLPPNFTWRSADNVNIPHTVESLKKLAQALLTYINACYQASWAHKEAIDSKTTLSDLESYDLNSNWPVASATS